MSRAVWKGPYEDPSLLQKVKKQKKTEKNLIFI